MKYTSYILALELSLFGTAHASQDDDAMYESAYDASDETLSDKRIACIEHAIANDIEKEDQIDLFAEECV
jgi:PHP family Zn ribbon phosphoesterase